MDAESVGGLESAGEDVFVGFGQDDVSGAHAAPSAVNGEKNVREILDERLLLLRVEHEVAVALFHVSERGEDVAADAEVGGTEVGAFFGVGERLCDAAEVFRGGHETE